MYRSLLVPLDGTPLGEQALPPALGIARRAGASLEVVHVHTSFEYYRVPSAVAPPMDEQARVDKRAYLDGIVSRLAAAGKAQATSTLLVGHAADAIHDHAVSKEVDLVVMTTQGRGPASRFRMGSVADKLMRLLPLPVLLVRPQEPEPDMAQEPVFKNDLVPLDGSELAEQILEPAVALGTLMQAEFTLLRVVDPIREFDEDIRSRRSIASSPSLRGDFSANATAFAYNRWQTNVFDAMH